MDELYLRLVLEGDASRFSYFIEKYKGMAYSIAYRILGRREDAEETVQDAFLKAFRSLDKFRGSSKFSTWFYRIVVNSSLSRVRTPETVTESLDENETSEFIVDDVGSAYRRLEAVEKKELVDRALGKLNVEDRLLLTLYYLNENSIEEISEITGMNRENLKMKLHRARGRMYRIIHAELKSEINTVLG